MVEPDSIPIGVYAFNSEGDQLGKVMQVEPQGLVLEDGAGMQHFVPMQAVETLSAGKLVIRAGFMP